MNIFGPVTIFFGAVLVLSLFQKFWPDSNRSRFNAFVHNCQRRGLSGAQMVTELIHFRIPVIRVRDAASAAVLANPRDYDTIITQVVRDEAVGMGQAGIPSSDIRQFIRVMNHAMESDLGQILYPDALAAVHAYLRTYGEVDVIMGPTQARQYHDALRTL